MNKPELSARIAAETSLSTPGADGAVPAVISTIDDALASGETVTIVGFGTFIEESTAGAPRPQVPRTGESVALDASKATSVKAGKTFRDAVRYPDTRARATGVSFVLVSGTPAAGSPRAVPHPRGEGWR